MIAYRKTEVGREAHLQAVKRYKAGLKGRATLKRYKAGPKAKAARKRYRVKALINSNLRLRNIASCAVYRAIKKGLLEREPCIICGDPDAQAHHFNYAKPLKVVFFCRKHHRMYHRKELTYV